VNANHHTANSFEIDLFLKFPLLPRNHYVDLSRENLFAPYAEKLFEQKMRLIGIEKTCMEHLKESYNLLLADYLVD
jgi:hypothetical protein